MSFLFFVIFAVRLITPKVRIGGSRLLPRTPRTERLLNTPRNQKIIHAQQKLSPRLFAEESSSPDCPAQIVAGEFQRHQNLGLVELPTPTHLESRNL
jgi:hypothetical protein